MKIYTVMTPEPLTRDDRISMGHQVAELPIEIGSMQDALKEFSAAKREQIAELQQQRLRISEQLKSGNKDVPVTVYDRRDIEGLTVETINAATGEILKIREMTPEERQMSIMEQGVTKIIRDVEQGKKPDTRGDNDKEDSE